MSDDLNATDASSKFSWTYGREQVFHVETTIARALSPDDYERHIKATISAMQLVIGLGGKANPVGAAAYSTPAAPPPETKAVAIARQAGGNEAAAAVQEALADIPQGEYETLDAVRLLVIPQPENRVTLEFYGERQKFPGVKANKWKLDLARALLKHVMNTDKVFVEANGQTVVQALDLTVACRVYYKLGKEYSYVDKQTGAPKTGHYKDVEHVRPLSP